MNPQNDDMFSFLLESESLKNASQFRGGKETAQAASPNLRPLYEGRLAVDVYDMGEEIIVLAPMAGVDPRTVEVSMHDDMLSIRGERLPLPLTKEALQQYHAECYWGPFSRSVVLPTDVVSGAAFAEYTHGLLTIRIPKSSNHAGHTIPIEVVEE